MIMHFYRRWIDLHIIIVPLALTWIPSIAADAYPACEGNFAPTPETCEKFAFRLQSNVRHLLPFLFPNV